MQTQMSANVKLAKLKERMKRKATENAINNAYAQNVPLTAPSVSEEEILKIFSTGESVEKTPRGTKPPSKKKPEEEVINLKTKIAGYLEIIV